jgi:predicted DNA binding protein
MMQLRFSAGGDSWLRDVCQECPAQVKILGLKMVGGQEVAHFVDISTKDESTERVKELLQASSLVRRTELTELAKNHLMGVVMADGCRVCKTLIDTDSASFISSSATQSNCLVAYKLFLNRDGVPLLLNKLSRNGVGYKVTEISSISEDSPLTEKQFRVLKSAMELGLFDYPRRITQDELAARLSISSGTLNEILRRAEKKILGGFLG